MSRMMNSGPLPPLYRSTTTLRASESRVKNPARATAWKAVMSSCSGTSPGFFTSPATNTRCGPNCLTTTVTTGSRSTFA